MRLTRKRSTTKNIIIDKSVDIEKMIIEQITYLNGILKDFKKQNNTQNDDVQDLHTTPFAIDKKIVKEVKQKVIQTITQAETSDENDIEEEQLETIEEEEPGVNDVAESIVFNLENILI